VFEIVTSAASQTKIVTATLQTRRRVHFIVRRDGACQITARFPEPYARSVLVICQSLVRGGRFHSQTASLLRLRRCLDVSSAADVARRIVARHRRRDGSAKVGRGLRAHHSPSIAISRRFSSGSATLIPMTRARDAKAPRGRRPRIIGSCRFGATSIRSIACNPPASHHACIASARRNSPAVLHPWDSSFECDRVSPKIHPKYQSSNRCRTSHRVMRQFAKLALRGSRSDPPRPNPDEGRPFASGRRTQIPPIWPCADRR
jgi:hypothetical protein